MAWISRRDFGAGAGALAAFAFAGRTARAALQSEPQGYPIAPDVQTTAQRTLVLGQTPPTALHLTDVSKFKQAGYGGWTFGGPLKPVPRTDLMPAQYAVAAGAKKQKLLKFFTITDVHITDKETPSQLIYLGHLHETSPVAVSVYSPTMLYTTHVLDAAVQTINALHKQDPFDCGISLGDICNSTQHNELRWYIDVLDGKVIVPSSGAHAGAGTIDYQKPYKAAGLDRSIPWYQCLGNHDHFWMGSLPVSAFLKASVVSDTVLLTGDLLRNPATIGDRDYYMGVIDGATSYGDIKYAGPVAAFASPPKVAPDPDRRSLSRVEWMKEFFATASNPPGHGFAMADADRGFACYSFVPKPAVPIKVIVLDDTQRDDDGSTDIHGHGFLDQPRWEWLKAQLAAGDAAGQLMIIAAHIPIGVEAPTSEMAWWPDPRNAVTLPELMAELQSHPNLLMWVSGHRHVNVVKAFPAPAGGAPENGFWQIETASLRDYPQQFRTFDIYLNTDDTISIVTTDVDPAVGNGTPAATSRSYAIAADQIVKAMMPGRSPTADPDVQPVLSASYNAELVKQLSPAMAAKMRALFPKP